MDKASKRTKRGEASKRDKAPEAFGSFHNPFLKATLSVEANRILLKMQCNLIFLSFSSRKYCVSERSSLKLGVAEPSFFGGGQTGTNCRPVRLIAPP